MITIAEIKNAILRGDSQIEIGGVVCKLPEPQRTGTSTQCDSYAYLKAVDINNKCNKGVSDVDKAKSLLQSEGYFIDNLWRVEDVTDRYPCSDDEAMAILYKALLNDNVMEAIWFAIQYEASDILNISLKESF